MKRVTAKFYRTEVGSEPVRDWLASFSREDRLVLGKDLAKVEFGWPLGMPVCRKVAPDIWEVRSTIRSGRVEARVYFTIAAELMLLLHGQEGKSGQDEAIRLARSRLASYRLRKDKDSD